MMLFASKEVGSRPASRVRVIAQSRWNGQVGIVVEVHGRTVLVRLGNDTIPFGISELRKVQ